MTNPVEIIPARDGEFGVNVFLMLTQWSPNGAAVQSRPLSLSEARELAWDLLAATENPTLSDSCVCGCGGSWFDPESDEYLESHVECDSCGSDFPIDDAVVEREVGHPDGEIYTRFYCTKCCVDVEDERDPEQDFNERLSMELREV